MFVLGAGRSKKWRTPVSFQRRRRRRKLSCHAALAKHANGWKREIENRQSGQPMGSAPASRANPMSFPEKLILRLATQIVPEKMTDRPVPGTHCISGRRHMIAHQRARISVPNIPYAETDVETDGQSFYPAWHPHTGVVSIAEMPASETLVQRSQRPTNLASTLDDSRHRRRICPETKAKRPILHLHCLSVRRPSHLKHAAGRSPARCLVGARSHQRAKGSS